MAKDIFVKSLRTIDGSLFHHTLTEADGSILTFGPEAHSHYEFFYLIKGDVTYVIEGKTYHIEPGDVIVVKVGEIHKLMIDLNEEYERVVIQFDRTILPTYFSGPNDLFSLLDDSTLHKHVIKKDIVNKTSIPTIIKEIMGIFDKNTYWHPLLISESIKLLVEMNKIYSSQYDERAIDATSKPIRDTIDYINENIERRLSLDEISSNVFISKFYLTRLFKLETGMTINEYVTTKKMHRANEMIVSGMEPGEAANKVGYANYSSFLYNYKKVFGMTPLQNRKNIKQ